MWRLFSRNDRRPADANASAARHAAGTPEIESLESRRLLSDVVLDWNAIAIDAAQYDRTHAGPVRAARNFATMHVAMYDAINGITGTREPFWDFRVPKIGADPQAAAVAAAFKTLSKIYPNQRGYLKSEYNFSLSLIPDGYAEKQGVKYGKQVANRVWNWRQFDGSRFDAFYEPGTRPGDWRPTFPDYRDALHPGAGEIEPFAIPSSRTFLPPPPPSLNSEEYEAAYYEVYDLGGRFSSIRTPDQTEIGVFWAYDRTGLGTPVALYNQVVRTLAIQEGNTLEENARLFALANVAMADAGITAWECKYLDSFWRPITAINEGDTDGNFETIGDPFWEPLGAPGGRDPAFTPPFPAYVSGHSTFGAATFQTLANFYGTDSIAFSLRSDELPGVVRDYTSFSQAAVENGRSRIYLGIHWSFDDTEGQAMGRAVADHVYGNYFGLTGGGSSVLSLTGKRI